MAGTTADETEAETFPSAGPLPPVAGPLPPVAGLRFRHFAGPADFPAMHAVMNDSRLADGNDFVASLADFSNYYSHLTNCDLERDVLIVDVAGTTVGYARASWLHEPATGRILETVCFLAPAWRRQGIGRQMLATIEARLREVDAGLPSIETRMFEAEAEAAAVGHVALLEGSGYAPVRHIFTMVRPDLEDAPGFPLPDGLEIREVQPDHLPLIWDADQEAFRDHWGWVPPSDEDYQQFLTDPMTNDTTLWRVAWAGDQVAGQVRSYINRTENEILDRRRGWVENISVGRAWRRRGLAKALMAASFPLLRARGMTEGALTVDVANPSGALQIYERMGFRPVSRQTIYRKPLG